MSSTTSSQPQRPGNWLNNPNRPAFQAPVAPEPPPGAGRRTATKAVAAKAVAKAARTEEFVPTSSPEWHVEHEWIPLDDMQIDPGLQRPEQVVEIAQIEKDFNWGAFGVPQVSRRSNGFLALIDGQQRRRAALNKGYGAQAVLTVVHYNLSLEDEARLFRQLNYRRSVSPIDLYRAALVEGRTNALLAHEILEPLGIKVGGNGQLACVATILRLVVRRNGQTNLAWALRTLQTLYGDGGANRDIYDKAVIEALFMMKEEWGQLIDDTRLREHMTKFSAGLPGLQKLRGAGVSVRAIEGGKLWVSIVDVIQAQYNKNLYHGSRRALPKWDRTRRTTETAAPEAPQVEDALESSQP